MPDQQCLAFNSVARFSESVNLIVFNKLKENVCEKNRFFSQLFNWIREVHIVDSVNRRSFTRLTQLVVRLTDLVKLSSKVASE